MHGNTDALEAVLSDPRAQGPDAIVVGGDVVPGPFAEEAVARIRAIEGPVQHWIRGNGEREEGGELASLPLTVTLDGVLFCHATPRRDDEMVTRISPQHRWDEVFAGVGEKLVVAGHTHQQHDQRAARTRYVNAGSVGLPYEGDSAARWVWIEDGEPELRSTPYDGAAAGRRMLEAGWPDERSVRAALLDPVDPMEVTRHFEGMAT